MSSSSESIDLDLRTPQGESGDPISSVSGNTDRRSCLLLLLLILVSQQSGFEVLTVLL